MSRRAGVQSGSSQVNFFSCCIGGAIKIEFFFSGGPLCRELKRVGLLVRAIRGDAVILGVMMIHSHHNHCL